MPEYLSRLRLAALWAALMFLYLYADFFALFPQGHIEAIMQGRIGPFEVTQASLFTAALLMALPAAMVALTPLLHTAACRWANVAMGTLYTLVDIGNLVGESWLFYLVYGGFEIVLTVSIAILAFVWLRPAPATAG